MGIVGRFIDAGNDAAKDRVIEAVSWTDDNSRFVEENDPSCRCLAGHKEDWYMDDGCSMPRAKKYREYNEYSSYQSYAYNRFPQLCDRFDKDRIVRLCKMRAAKGNEELVEKIRSGIYWELRETPHV